MKQCAELGNDLPILHMNNAIGLSGEFVVMSHNHEGGPACFVQRTHQSEQSVSAVCIEVARRFIGQNQVWFLHQGTCHRDALLLAAGQFSRLVMQAMPQSDFREEGGCIGLDGTGFATLYERRHGGIFQCGELSQQMVKLKHEADPPISELRLLGVRHSKKVLSIERDTAPARCIERANDVEQGTFTGPRSAHNGHEFTALNLEVDSLENRQLVRPHRKGLMKTTDLDHTASTVSSAALLQRLFITQCGHRLEFRGLIGWIHRRRKTDQNGGSCDEADVLGQHVNRNG